MIDWHLLLVTVKTNILEVHIIGYLEVDVATNSSNEANTNNLKVVVLSKEGLSFRSPKYIKQISFDSKNSSASIGVEIFLRQTNTSLR